MLCSRKVAGRVKRDAAVSMIVVELIVLGTFLLKPLKHILIPRVQVLLTYFGWRQLRIQPTGSIRRASFAVTWRTTRGTPE